MADLSQLSAEDRLALQSGDLSRISTAALLALKGWASPAYGAGAPVDQSMPAVANDSQSGAPASTKGGAQRPSQLAAALRRLPAPGGDSTEIDPRGKQLGAALAYRFGLPGQTLQQPAMVAAQGTRLPDSAPNVAQGVNQGETVAANHPGANADAAGAAGAGDAQSQLPAGALDNTKDVFSENYLKNIPGLRIQGEGDQDLAGAMRVLHGARDSQNGRLDVGATQAQRDQALQTIARVRGVSLDKIRQDYGVYAPLRQRAEVRAHTLGQKDGPYIEGAPGESRIPLLSLSKTDTLPDNSAHMASNQQLRSGKLVGDAFGGLDPVFGALLNPTGGIPGEGNREIGPLLYAIGGGKAVVNDLAVAHDAAGYLSDYHRLGPGRHFVPNASQGAPDPSYKDGLSDGMNFFYNLRNFGGPRRPITPVPDGLTP